VAVGVVVVGVVVVGVVVVGTLVRVEGLCVCARAVPGCSRQIAAKAANRSMNSPRAEVREE
jgi:hypothetical protein